MRVKFAAAALAARGRQSPAMKTEAGADSGAAARSRSRACASVRNGDDDVPAAESAPPSQST